MSSARKANPKRPPLPKRTRPPAPSARPAPASAPRPRPAVSDPEIRFEYGPAGRETLSAIAEEVVDLARDLQKQRYAASSPEIQIAQTSIGRETVDDIARELAESGTGYESEPSTAVRQRALTQGYEERRHGQDTLDDIARALGASDVARAPRELEIYEMATFVVRGTDLAVLSSEDGRRRFVEERLLSRLPVRGMDEVVRIDVTPWTAKSTLIVRVWCALPA